MTDVAVHTWLLKACSPMPLAVAFLKPLQGWKRPVGQLSAAIGSLSAIQSTLMYLMSSAAVSWAASGCFMVLLHGKGALHKVHLVRPLLPLESGHITSHFDSYVSLPPGVAEQFLHPHWEHPGGSVPLH